jgi:hypothetical protein
MTALHVRPEAELDMFEAALWYDGERSGLRVEFLKAVRCVFSRTCAEWLARESWPSCRPRR